MSTIRPMVVVEKRKTYIPHILAIALCWSAAMTMDYHDEAAAERENAMRMSAQMAECMNGNWRGITPSGEQIGCMPAETLKPEERSSK